MAQPRSERGSSVSITPATDLVMREVSSQSPSLSTRFPTAIVFRSAVARARTRVLSKDTVAPAAREAAHAVVVTNDLSAESIAKQGGGNKVGERIVDERATILSDPPDAQLPSHPLDNDGLPLGRQVWIDNGAVKQRHRLNDSPLFVLNNVHTLGFAERRAGTEAGADIVMPSINVYDFNFTSLSEAV